jgi:predicted lipoprotein with Yx(FWY)xxD motif
MKLLLVGLSCAGSLALAGVAFGGAAHTSAAGTVVTTKQTSSLGPILATSSGQTLYYDNGDKPPHFACTSGCLSAWPPLLAKGTVKAAGSAKASLLGTVKGPGGTMVTYNHHPLYTFAGDSKGSTSGEGQNGFYALNAAGAKATKPKTTTNFTTTTSTTTTKKKPQSKAPGY